MAKYGIMKAVEYDDLPVKFKKLHPFENFGAEGYWLQKKYDGCFGMAVIRGGGNESKMLSRTLEDYTASCGHILIELRDAAESWLGRWHFDDFVVLGEVWQPAEEASFPTISGKFRRQRPSTDLKFVANDLLPANLNTLRSYEDRFEDLENMLPPEDGASTLVAETFKDGWAALTAKALALQWKHEGGFDGAILRNPKSGYTVGDVKAGEIIKVKPTLSLDLAILRTDVAPGAKTGRPVYTIAVEYRGVVSFVGSGVPHTLSWSAGDIVEVECLGITDDGKLREPRWKGLRHDKLGPDA